MAHLAAVEQKQQDDTRHSTQELETVFLFIERKLVAALPSGHPLLKEMERAMSKLRQYGSDTRFAEEAVAAAEMERPDWEGILMDLTGKLGQWKRGIADWSEVQPLLKEAEQVCDWLGVGPVKLPGATRD